MKNKNYTVTHTLSWSANTIVERSFFNIDVTKDRVQGYFLTIKKNSILQKGYKGDKNFKNFKF